MTMSFVDDGAMEVGSSAPFHVFTIVSMRSCSSFCRFLTTGGIFANARVNDGRSVGGSSAKRKRKWLGNTYLGNK